MPTEVLSDQNPNTALSAWVPDDVAYAMRLSAAINRRSISAEVRHAIDLYLLKNEGPAPHGANVTTCDQDGGRDEASF